MSTNLRRFCPLNTESSTHPRHDGLQPSKERTIQKNQRVKSEKEEEKIERGAITCHLDNGKTHQKSEEGSTVTGEKTSEACDFNTL
jgi:hypothetical protein